MCHFVASFCLVVTSCLANGKLLVLAHNVAELEISTPNLAEEEVRVAAVERFVGI